MKKNFMKIMAMVLVLMMVITHSTVVMMQVFGAGDPAADAGTATGGNGPKPIAAYDLRSGLSNSKEATGRDDLADIILDPESDQRTDADRLASTSHSGRANYNDGIEMWNGFFSLPDNVFSGIDASQVDGITVSFKMYNITGWWVGEGWYADWARILFSFSEKDVYADKENTDAIEPPTDRVAASFFMTRNGNVGTAPYQYGNTGDNEYEKAWLDGVLGGFPYETEHTVTVTYDVASNTATAYLDGWLAGVSTNAAWTPGASLTAEQIHSFTSFMFGRPNAGNFGNWGLANYKDVTIYSTALTMSQVKALVSADTIQEGWAAVENNVESEPKEPVLKGEGDGTFTVATLNVDGMPSKVTVNKLFMNTGSTTVELNKGGKDAAGATSIGNALKNSGWDIVAVQENFNYNGNLREPLSGLYNGSEHSEGTIPTTISLADLQKIKWPLDMDGLGLLWKNTLDVKEVKKQPWSYTWSTDVDHGVTVMGRFIGVTLPDGSGGDRLIAKGFRYFQATIADGLVVDVYTLHMDAENSTEDRLAREIQMKDLVEHIKSANTSNPIIIMGDTNSRYTHTYPSGTLNETDCEGGSLEALLIGAINKIDGLEAKDAWVETVYDGVYPASGIHDMTVNWCGYEYGEVVDKIIFINNEKSDYYLRVDDFTVDTSYLEYSDHPAVAGTFTYVKKNTITYTDGSNTIAEKVFNKNNTPVASLLKGNATPTYTESGKDVEELNTRTGYVFKGWTTDSSKVLNVAASWTSDWAETISGDATYYAVWNKLYTVKYVSGVDDASFTEKVFENREFGTPIPAYDGATPTRTGYVFDGWNTSGNMTVTGTVEDDLTYTAVWAEDRNNNGKKDADEEKYTVTYKDGADGSVFTDEKYENLLEGDATPAFSKELSTLKREGWTAPAWDKAIESTVTGNATYTLTWKADANGNGVPDEDEGLYSVTYSDGLNGEVFPTQTYSGLLEGTATPEFKGEVPKRAGYIFGGWNPEWSATVGKEDVTYTAIWLEDFNNNDIDDATEDHFNVTYTDGVDDETVFEDQVFENVLVGLETPAFVGTPTRTGYVFGGWDPEVAKTVTATVTYKAVWLEDKNNNGIDDAKEDHFTVTYTDGVDDETVFEDQVFQNILVGLETPAFDGTPTRAGYIFGGWDPEVAATVTATVTYKAVWLEDKNGNNIDDATEDHFTVTYTDGVDDETVFEDQVFANILVGLATPAFDGTPTREGYIFGGWKPAVAATVTADATYTAVWKQDENKNDIPDEEETFTVTFVDENDEVVGTVTKTYGETLTDSDYPEAPVKEGYYVEWPVIEDPIKSDITVKAIYVELPTGDIDSDIEIPDLPEDVDLGVYVVTNTIKDEEHANELIEKLLEQLGDLAEELNHDTLLPVDISLYTMQGVKVEALDGLKVLVTITLPDSINSENGVVIYRLEEDGTFTKLDATVEDGTLVFETEHFSEYVIAEMATKEAPGTDDPTPDTGDTDPDGPAVTGDDSSMWLWIMLVVISMAVVGLVIYDSVKSKAKKSAIKK